MIALCVWLIIKAKPLNNTGKGENHSCEINSLSPQWFQQYKWEKRNVELSLPPPIPTHPSKTKPRASDEATGIKYSIEF